MRKSHGPSSLLHIAATAATAMVVSAARAATPVVVQNDSGFEGAEEPTVIYYPDTNTFQNDSYVNIVDEGGGMHRSTLRNYYPTLGWWDGDRDTTNTDRQRAEVKGIVGLGHQFVDQTFEYSFDFRTDPTFVGTDHFCHIFQLKALDGDDGPPLATVSLYKNSSGVTEGRVYTYSDGTGEQELRTFSFTAGQWQHVDIRITTCSSTESTGAIVASVNGDAFSGLTNAPIYLAGSTEYRPKWGLYRGMGTDYGVPTGDSWVEDRTVTGYQGTSNVLTWKGGSNNNTWDTGVTQNFLNGANASAFNTIDQTLFTDSSTNTTVNIPGSVWPGFIDVNSSKNYTFNGTGAISGGVLRKEGTGTLTLATANSYAGLTDVRGGTLLVTGSIGNNSLVSLTGGTLKLGSATALGTNSAIGAQINGGVLDLNGFGVGTDPISVQGTGLGAGAIIDSGAQQTTAMSNVTLTGDTTIGGTGRWDIRGTSPVLSTGGNGYNLTKTGANQITLVGVAVDAALGNINLNQGVLGFQTSTSSMGDPTKTIAMASGTILDFYNTTAVMNKVCALNGGTIFGESGTGSQNTFGGAITMNGSGGIFDAGDGLTGGSPKPTAVLTISGGIGGNGGATKNGPGLVTFSGMNTYSGSTTVNNGTLSIGTAASLPDTAVNISTGGDLSLAAGIGGTTIAALNITGGGVMDVNNDRVLINYGTNADPVTTIRGYLASGYNGGGWNGTGLVSSAANGTQSGSSKYALGYADSGDLGNPANLATGTMEVKYTLVGDLNLDGAVSGADFATLAGNFNSLSSPRWDAGDVTYDGAISGADFAALAGNFGKLDSGASIALSAADWAAFDAFAGEQAGFGTAVPEPGTVGVLAMGAIGVMKRRRHRGRP